MAKRGRPKIPRAERLTAQVLVSMTPAMEKRIEAHAVAMAGADAFEGKVSIPAAARDLIERGLKSVERKR